MDQSCAPQALALTQMLRRNALLPAGAAVVDQSCVPRALALTQPLPPSWATAASAAASRRAAPLPLWAATKGVVVVVDQRPCHRAHSLVMVGRSHVGAVTHEQYGRQAHVPASLAHVPASSAFSNAGRTTGQG